GDSQAALAEAVKALLPELMSGGGRGAAGAGRGRGDGRGSPNKGEPSGYSACPRRDRPHEYGCSASTRTCALRARWLLMQSLKQDLPGLYASALLSAPGVRHPDKPLVADIPRNYVDEHSLHW